MTEDELIFLGAAILFGPMIAGERDPEEKIQTAVEYAHLLHKEVKKAREKIAARLAEQQLKEHTRASGI